MRATAARSLSKAVLDRSVAAAGLLLSSPVILAAALGVRVAMGRPVFFTQLRPGLDAKPFHLWKFRTMNNDRDARGRLLPDDARLTKFGRFLRSTSIDELPQLWNVLRGDMSLVGPRPLLMQYVQRYSPEQARRLEVKPGITGWAQVKGRNALSWDEKFALDVWYVNHWTLALDLRIIVMTVVQVLRREGISSQGHATTFEFMGNLGPKD
jgi:lipopolysaccharide/colanic/teichoic acid biosynthesis glycosyltransferase